MCLKKGLSNPKTGLLSGQMSVANTIITDQVMSKLGVVDAIKKTLQQNNVQSAIYNGVASEPMVYYVQEGLKVYKDNVCDFLLAVGGGATLLTLPRLKTY